MAETAEGREYRLEKLVQAYREWQSGGQTQRDYCERKGIRFWQFKAGVEDARRAGMLARVKRRDATVFAPVEIITHSTEYIGVKTTAFC